jgi:hypothetical protein
MFTNEYYQILNIGKYSQIEQISDNLLMIKKNKMIGFIDITLTNIIKPIYLSYKIISDINLNKINIVVYTYDYKCILLDINTGKNLSYKTSNIYYDLINDVYYTINIYYKTYLMNRYGKQISKIYNSINNFKGKYYTVKLNNKYGIINSSGKIIVDTIYNEYQISDVQNNFDYIIKILDRNNKIKNLI